MKVVLDTPTTIRVEDVTADHLVFFINSENDIYQLRRNANSGSYEWLPCLSTHTVIPMAFPSVDDALKTAVQWWEYDAYAFTSHKKAVAWIASIYKEMS